MYKALKQCKYDRKYSVGEVIPDGVADLECLKRAIEFGYVQEVEDAGKAEESSEEAQDQSAEVTEQSEEEAELEEEAEQSKRRGRKKAVK